MIGPSSLSLPATDDRRASQSSNRLHVSTQSTTSVICFGVVTGLFVATAGVVAGLMPLGFSVATVFLFAGPHNWFEARYFLSCMPARWGRLRTYFTVGLAGVVLLTTAQIVMTIAYRHDVLAAEWWLTGITIWNSLLLIWVTSLVLMRSRQNPRRPSWDQAVPMMFVLLAVNWLWPLAWNLVLVYLHPILALVFLDRELSRRRSGWQTMYRRCLWLVPAVLMVLWWRLADRPNLPGEDLLSIQITHHAGSGIFNAVSTHLLVSTHTFLAMLHYGVWVLAIPLLNRDGALWDVSRFPLARSSRSWKHAVMIVLCVGGLMTVALWVGFLMNYPLTRDIYFIAALGHVLAEFPFLLRQL